MIVSDFQKLHTPHMFVTAMFIVSSVLLFQVHIFIVKGLALNHPRDFWEWWGMVIDAWTYNAADNSEEEEEQSDSKSVRISLHKFISMFFKLRTRSHAKCHPLLLLLFRFVDQAKPTNISAIRNAFNFNHTCQYNSALKTDSAPEDNSLYLGSDIRINFNYLSKLKQSNNWALLYGERPS